MEHGRERRRSELALEAAVDQRPVMRRRQGRLEPGLRRPLDVVDDELLDRGNRNRQDDRLAVAQPEPGRPVAQRSLVAAHGVLGFALGEQCFDGISGEGRQNRRVQRRDVAGRELDRREQGSSLHMFHTIHLMYYV